MKRSPLHIVVFFLVVGILSFHMGNLMDKALKHFGLPEWLEPVLPMLILLAVIKWRLIKALPKDIDIKPTLPDYHPWLDTNKLSAMAADCENLGFEWQGDYVLTPNPSGGIKTYFFRLFTHPEHRCFAEVAQAVLANDTTVPVFLEIASELDSDRFVSTIARRPTAVGSLTKHPCAAIKHTEQAPAELMKTHLQQRSEVIANCNAEVLPNLSPETYFARQSSLLKSSISILNNKSMFLLPIELIYYSIRPRSEWRGKRTCKPDSK